jgi:serine/threonine protein kinase
MTGDRMLGKVPPTPDGRTAGEAEGQGRLIGRRYRLLSPVGRGGMGKVWHAHDVLLDRDVAVKELMLPFGLDQAGTQNAHRRVLREARSAARLSHPGIVTVHDVVEEDGRPWIVMELVRAWSLEQAVRQNGPIPVAQTAEIGIRVLDALRHAHAAGILHRDVKPGNVLLTTDRVVLTDFGIAAIEGDVTTTQTGLLMGSPAYIPPERLSGHPITHAADLWSFGATMYAAVEGRPPYEGPDAVAVLGAILTQEPSRPRRAGALLPLIEGLLRKNPAERISAAQASDLLERVLRSHGSAVPHRGNPQAPVPPPVAAPVPTVPPDPIPMEMMPPLDLPSGPMPSRIIETPSGPVRVPVGPPSGVSAPPGGVTAPPPAESGPYDALRSASGPYDALRSPSEPHDALRSPSGPYDALGSPSGPVAEGGAAAAYDALRSASGPTHARRPLDDGRGERPGRAQRARPEEPAPAGGLPALLTEGWLRDGRPTPRLLMVAAGTALAVIAVVLIATSGGSDEPSAPAPSPANTAAAPAPTAQAPSAGETKLPEGFKKRTQNGLSVAVPQGWKVSTGAGTVTFTGPADTWSSIKVEEAAPAADGGLSALQQADRSALAEYIEIQLEATAYRGWKAADWEYTYVRDNNVPMHTLVRYVTVNAQQAYRITISMAQVEWDDAARVRATFLSTFTPGG